MWIEVTNNQLTDDSAGQRRVDPVINSLSYNPEDWAAGVVISSGIGGVWQWPYYLAASTQV